MHGVTAVTLIRGTYHERRRVEYSPHADLTGYGRFSARGACGQDGGRPSGEDRGAAPRRRGRAHVSYGRLRRLRRGEERRPQARGSRDTRRTGQEDRGGGWQR